MIRRWLIRSLCLALLTLCVTAWVGSYWEQICVKCYSASHAFDAEVLCGAMILGDEFHPEWHNARTWWWNIGAANREVSQNQFRETKYHALGFGLKPSPADPYVYAMIPLWFPTLLSALFLCFVWRKTRHKPPSRGFPVETTASHQPPRP
jgi:hypothetical protein